MTELRNQALSQWHEAGQGSLLLSGSILVVMLVAAVNPALPAIAVHFADHPERELLARLSLTLPALFVALGSLATGPACDRIGRKSILCWSVAGFASSGAVCFFALSMEMLLLGRCLQGLFAAGVATACTTLIADLYQGDRRTRMIGLQGATVAISSMGLVLLGGLLAAVSWRAPFGLYMATAALLPPLLLVIRVPKMSARPAQAVLPVVRQIWPIMLFATSTSVVMFMPTINTPFLLQAEGIVDPRLTGVALAMMTGAGVLSALNYARIARRVAPWQLFVPVLLSASLGMAMMGALPGYLAKAGGLVFIGIAMGLMMPGLTVLVLDQVAAKSHAIAIGLLTSSLFIGEFLSPLLTELPKRPFGLSGLFLTGAVVAACGALAVKVMAYRKGEVDGLTPLSERMPD